METIRRHTARAFIIVALGFGTFVGISQLFGIDVRILNLLAVLFAGAGTVGVMLADVYGGIPLWRSEKPESRPLLGGWLRIIGTALLLASAAYAIVAAFKGLVG
ncbi:hypothetical protein [Microbacterium sp. SGAir0570]|uniref:hypothetical protein n=1 Tax=Microbacterium sp. SGAir0570 TaxID=2070348 RepID=UPI0010F83028|nr:hypothetical protein [Microbacterium sp. SGAir0570]